MAAENIFQQYLQPVRSVQDYSNDMDRQEQNALTLAAGRMKAKTDQQAMADDQAYREAAMQAGGDQNALVKALMGRGLVKQAQTVQTGMLETDAKRATTAKTKAETDTSQFELRRKKHDQALKDISGLQNSDQARANLQAHIDAGDIDPTRGQAIMESIPQDPSQFGGWQLGMLRNLLTAKEQFEAGSAKPTEVTTGQQKYWVDNNPNSPTFGQKVGAAPVQMVATPDAQLSAETTRRGQKLTDERARETLAQGKVPAGYRANKDGSMSFIPGGPADPSVTGKGALNDSQSKAALFGSRMQDANGTLAELADKGVNTNAGSSLGFGMGGLVTALSSADKQRLDQAKRDFVNAVLRRESGASISPTEFDSAEKQYFPQLGDKPEVIAQKKRNREIAVRGMLAEIPENQREKVVSDIRGGSSSGKVVNFSDLK